ncbi:hypothetical protein IGI04_010225 [Brassica rapa subsp. trilocularis]|uniref:Rx N-terminal domain-containing protein n=1 Tax=Brassica rapa subsp. trilocularis TaxID=1813537 RepID=A0ABQ7N1Y1_BRACM|nr:hypothetical protein IGI04_010225 [Brassica rapa subsp. trilocularis]
MSCKAEIDMVAGRFMDVFSIIDLSGKQSHQQNHSSLNKTWMDRKLEQLEITMNVRMLGMRIQEGYGGRDHVIH